MAHDVAVEQAHRAALVLHRVAPPARGRPLTCRSRTSPLSRTVRPERARGRCTSCELGSDGWLGGPVGQRRRRRSPSASSCSPGIAAWPRARRGDGPGWPSSLGMHSDAWCQEQLSGAVGGRHVGAEPNASASQGTVRSRARGRCTCGRRRSRVVAAAARRTGAFATRLVSCPVGSGTISATVAPAARAWTRAASRTANGTGASAQSAHTGPAGQEAAVSAGAPAQREMVDDAEPGPFGDRSGDPAVAVTADGDAGERDALRVEEVERDLRPARGGPVTCKRRSEGWVLCSPGSR